MTGNNLEHHEVDTYAHPQAMQPLLTRLTEMEKWQQRAIGAFGLLTFSITIVAVLVTTHLLPL